MTQDISSTATLERMQNPGYEVLKDIYWMKAAQGNLASEKIRYYLPAKALLSACMAIDGYVNVVGSRVDSQWEYIDEASAPIKERLVRIYKNLNRPLDLNRGIWEDVLLIFSLREDINRYELASIYGMQEAVVPAIFKVIEQKYPIRLTHAIAEGAIELLLNISE
jgi:hypothetical protein